MKNLSLILNVVVIIGLGLLYFLHFNSTPANTSVATTSGSAAIGEAQMAFVNIDTILMNYTLATELNDAIVSKQAKMKAKLDKEMDSFQKEYQVFLDKAQRGIYLTQQRQQEAQQQLAARQQELQELEYDYSNQLAAEQQKMNARLFDSINSYIKAYNTPEKFQVIMGHAAGGNMLYGSPQIDITKEVITGLNDRYTAAE